MKRILPLLLLPVMAIAQQGQPPQMEQQAFEQIKKNMLPMLQQALPAMQETLACVQATGNSADLQQCAQQMVEFSRQMAIMSGVPADQVPEPPPGAMQMEWSEQLKGQIVTDISQSIERAKATLSCLESSSESQQMGACMQQHGGGRRR